MHTVSFKGNRATESDAESKRKELIFSPPSTMQTATKLKNRELREKEGRRFLYQHQQCQQQRMETRQLRGTTEVAYAGENMLPQQVTYSAEVQVPPLNLAALQPASTSSIRVAATPTTSPHSSDFEDLRTELRIRDVEMKARLETRDAEMKARDAAMDARFEDMLKTLTGLGQVGVTTQQQATAIEATLAKVERRVHILERDMGKRIDGEGAFQESINKKVTGAADAHTD
jgi:hypothetical protein